MNVISNNYILKTINYVDSGLYRQDLSTLHLGYRFVFFCANKEAANTRACVRLFPLRRHAAGEFEPVGGALANNEVALEPGRLAARTSGPTKKTTRRFQRVVSNCAVSGKSA